MRISTSRLPERLYAYDCPVPTAPEADKLQIEA